MGNQIPRKLERRQSNVLESCTSFSRDEIMDLYAQFRFLSCGNPTLPRETLAAYLEAMVPNQQTRVLRSLLAAFDVDSDKEIDFRGFCTSLAISHSKLQDSLEVTFSMFDKAGESWITKEEFMQSLLAMQRCFDAPQLLGEVPGEFKTQEGIEAWVDTIYEQFDKEGKGKLDFTNFKLAVQQHPMLVKLVSTYINDGCKNIFQDNGRRRGSYRSRSKSRARSFSIQGISNTLGLSKSPTPDGSLENRNLKVLICVDNDKNSYNNVLSIPRLLRREDILVLYHQPNTGADVAAGNAALAKAATALEGRTEVPIDQHVEISESGKADAACLYCDVHSFDIVSMGHPGHDSNSNLPWKVIENFTGVGVLIGHVPVAIPLVFLLVIDESEAGTHAVDLMCVMAKKDDRILVMSTWKPPSLADIGTAMNATSQEWDAHVRKLKDDAQTRATTACRRLRSTPAEISPENVVSIVVESPNSEDLKKEVGQLGLTYQLHVLVTGLRSNSACRKLFTMFRGLPGQTAMSALWVMN